MKKIIIMAVLAMATVSLSAQKYGVKAGVNFSSYSGSDASGLNSVAGFQIGGLYEMPLSAGFFLQPSALITLKGAKSSSAGIDQTMSPIYLEVPVRGMYKFEVGPGKLTVAAGPYLAFGLFGNMTTSGGGGSVSLFSKEDGASDALLNRFDLGLSSAVGYELASGVFVNLESSLGWLNVSTNKDTDLKNSTLSLVAGYKF